MYHDRTLSRHYVLSVAWLLLGGALGLHFPDIDERFKWLIPSWLLLHRSILTHGLIASLLLFRVVQKSGGRMPSLRLFVMGLNLALAIHLCFDFFPLGWNGFALIHIPVYGWTSALFSQAWIIISIIVCLAVAFRLARNVLDLALSAGHLIIFCCVAAAENSGPVALPLFLLAVATGGALVMVNQVQKATVRRA